LLAEALQCVDHPLDESCRIYKGLVVLELILDRNKPERFIREYRRRIKSALVSGFYTKQVQSSLKFIWKFIAVYERNYWICNVKSDEIIYVKGR
jgi:hypothetical protein